MRDAPVAALHLLLGARGELGLERPLVHVVDKPVRTGTERDLPDGGHLAVTVAMTIVVGSREDWKGEGRPGEQTKRHCRCRAVIRPEGLVGSPQLVQPGEILPPHIKMASGPTGALPLVPGYDPPPRTTHPGTTLARVDGVEAQVVTLPALLRKWVFLLLVSLSIRSSVCALHRLDHCQACSIRLHLSSPARGGERRGNFHIWQELPRREAGQAAGG